MKFHTTPFSPGVSMVGAPAALAMIAFSALGLCLAAAQAVKPL
jgi:hypothetical protein